MGVLRILYKKILNNVLVEMKKQGKLQRELTDYLQVSKNVFTDWKSGKNHSFMKYLPQIAEFLDVSVDYLLGKTEQKEKTAPEERSLDEIQQELITLTADMDEDEKNALLGYAARIIAKHKKED